MFLQGVYAAAFGGHLFMTYFYKAGGDMTPRPLPGSATVNYKTVKKKFPQQVDNTKIFM